MKANVFTVLLCSCVAVGVCHADTKPNIEKLIDELSQPRASNNANSAAPKGESKGYTLIYQTRKSQDASTGTQYKEVETPSQGVMRVETQVHTWPPAAPAVPEMTRYQYVPPAVPVPESMTYEQKDILTADASPIRVETETQVSPPGARSSQISGMMLPRVDESTSRSPVMRTKSETQSPAPVYVETETVTSPAPHRQYSIMEGNR